MLAGDLSLTAPRRSAGASPLLTNDNSVITAVARKNPAPRLFNQDSLIIADARPLSGTTLEIEREISSATEGWVVLATLQTDDWPVGVSPSWIYTTTGWQAVVVDAEYPVAVDPLATGPVLVRWTGAALEVDLNDVFDDLPQEQEVDIIVMLRFDA